jgi:hypothetical protein
MVMSHYLYLKPPRLRLQVLAYCEPPYSRAFAARALGLVERCRFGQLREGGRQAELRRLLLRGFVEAAQAMRLGELEGGGAGALSTSQKACLAELAAELCYR